MNSPSEPERPPNEDAQPAVARPPALWPSIESGSLAEYVAFYKTAVPQIAAYLMVTQRASKLEAAECAHEALVEYLHRREGVRKPMPWCRRAATSIFLKRMYDALESYEDIPATGAPLYGSDPTDETQRGLLLPLIEQLPPRQREVATLVLAGYFHREIADELGISEEAVRSNLRHAKTRMKELYDQRATGQEGPR